MKISPVKKGVLLTLPTIEEARANPLLLKRLPGRWQKNAAVVACVGFVGVVALTGCGLSGRDYRNGGDETPQYTLRPVTTPEPVVTPEPIATPEPVVPTNHFIPAEPVEFDEVAHLYKEAVRLPENEDLVFLVHGGGAGSAVYVAHLTEQEAFGIIRAHLEAVGLRFDEAPPEYSVNIGGWRDIDFRFDLFDVDKNVAVSNVSWGHSNLPFTSRGSWLARDVADEFAKLNTGINIGVFYNPGEYFWQTEWEWDEGDGYIFSNKPAAEEIAERRPILEQRLAEQVYVFIAWLYNEGVLE
jgi:hypothetical protein